MIRNDKLIPSPLPDIYAPRCELISKFHKVAAKRFVYVTAPEGYGKTVSALLWAKDSGRKIIWINLDSYDNSLPVFFKLLCSGILSVQPDNQNMRDILNSASFSSSPVEHTIRLISEFKHDNKTLYALIFDNDSLITNGSIAQAAVPVLQRLPYSFVIFFLTRNEPVQRIIESLKMPYEKTLEPIDDERMSYISTEQFLFSEDEIRQYFTDLDLVISSDEAAAVRAITGGLPVNVDFIAKSGQIDFVKNNNLERLIKEKIWDEWDDALKDFTLKTSIVNEMTPCLCEKLTGRRDSGDILDMLHHTYSFVTCLDKDTYCYQPLILDFLNNQLYVSGTDVNDLYKKAGAYYLDIGAYFMSARYVFWGGDPDAITQTLENILHKNIALDEVVSMFKAYYSDVLPEKYCSWYPVLYIMRAWYYFLCGDVTRMEYYLDKMYLSLPEIKRDYPQFLDIAVSKIIIDPRLDYSELTQKLTDLQPDVLLYDGCHGDSLSLELPFLHRSNRDCSSFAMKEMWEPLMTFVEFLLKKNHVSARIVSCIISGIYMEQNRLKEALETILLEKKQLYENSFTDLEFSFFMHHTAIYHALGLSRQTEDMLNETESHIENHNACHLRANFMAYKFKIMLMDGSKTAAQSWLDNYAVTETEQLAFYKIFQHFTTVRAHIVLGQVEEAMIFVLKLRQLAKDLHRPLDIAEAGVLQAILEWNADRKTEAQATLETVLTDMQSYGFIRVIAEEGASVLPIIKKVIKKIEKPSYKGVLDSEYINSVNLAAYEQSKRHRGIAVHISKKQLKLSRQQTNMIILLSKGYKAAQIAELTGLKLTTVKTHIYIAYEKLDVSKAMDAVIKAKELGIIE